MSKDIATAMIRMLEYGKGMTKPAKAARKSKETIDIDSIDLAEIYLKLEGREKKIKASKEAIEKLMKKDEKKKESGMDLQRLAFILVATFPITGPLYFNWLRSMLH